MARDENSERRAVHLLAARFSGDQVKRGQIPTGEANYRKALGVAERAAARRREDGRGGKR